MHHHALQFEFYVLNYINTVCGHTPVCIWGPEVVRLGSRCPYPLSHLAASMKHFCFEDYSLNLNAASGAYKHFKVKRKKDDSEILTSKYQK